MRNAKFLKKRKHGAYRVIALLLCLATILPILHTAGISAKADSGENYKDNIGAAVEIVSNSVNVLRKTSGDFVATDMIYGISKNYLPYYLVIKDYAYIASGEFAGHWYYIDAAKGQTWPSIYEDYHWVKVTDVRVIVGNAEIKDADGNQASVVSMQWFHKVGLTVVSDLEGELGYQWQICYDWEKDLWSDIKGQTAQRLLLSFGMVASLLRPDSDGNTAALIRCKAISADNIAYSKSTKVILDSGELTSLSAYVAEDGIALCSDDGIALLDEEQNSDVKKTYDIVINYTFENNTQAANPYTANLAEGSPFNATVTFPTVQGYLPYVNDEQQNSIDLNYPSVSENVTINVVYKPTNVNYTVIHYKQNVNDDNYTIESTETKQGLTGSQVPEVATTFEGFYSLLYERPNIAADGSTVIEVYYDRYYYLMNFDMGGGFGTDPIYARYGATISDVKDPQKAGYEFKGWLKTDNGTEIVTLPETMPAENRTYYAKWDPDPTAKVTVVFWGENADDEGYSYLADSTKVINLKPDKEFTYSENEMLVCDKEVHTHDNCNITCDKEEHTHSAVGGSCYTLTCTVESHKHSTSCYDGVGTEHRGHPSAPSNPKNGQVYTSDGLGGYGGYTIIYIDGTWYNYTGSTASGSVAPTTCGKEENTHTHTDDCYKLTCTTEVHTHSKECYSCGMEEHTHNSDCYMQGVGLDTKLWKFVKSDTVTVAADGSTVCNVYYDRTTFTLTFNANRSTVATIQEKWGAEISGKFNAAPFNTTYNGRAWQCTDSSKYGYALQTLDRMPQFDATFNLYDKSSQTLKTIYYYVEIPGSNVSNTTWPSNQTNFKLLKKVSTYFNYATYDEEYHEIQGYVRYSKNVSGFSGNQKDFSNNTLYLYYLCDSYKLTFNDGYNDVRKEEVDYTASLGSFSTYIPEVPSAYEKGSVYFGGWYQNPECTGEEYKLDAHTMPSNDLILYAKWVPVTHKVDFYLTEQSKDVYQPKDADKASFKVPHADNIAEEYVKNHLEKSAMNTAKPNGSYTFVMWYYYDEDGNKMPFDPTTQIRKDLTLYGEWSSNVLKEYTVRYVLQDGTQIAKDLTGSGLAGTTKTFDAKGGTDLYEAYQEGYFPTVQSQSLLLDIDSNSLVITFEYVPAEAVPYTVKYVDKDTGKSLADDKVVSDNRKAVVTETFKPISGYMPDAYQKRLVVTADGENILYFYYSKDETHAYYKITHYIQNTDGETWTEYASSQVIGDIGTRYTASPMTIPGFTYKDIKYVVNGVEVTDVTTEGAALTADGLEINLYYVRNAYPYQVRYLEQGTGTSLHDPKNGSGKYGQIISESAIDIDDYEKVDPSSATLNIRIDEGEGAPKINIITFYYKEKEVTINYVAVGPNGATNFGSVGTTAETLKVKTGTAQGSTATPGDGFKFVGWYKDKDCTQPVDASWVSGNTIVPQKTDGKNVAATYYAKFEYDITSLEITKSGWNEIDEDQTFLFRIVGKDVDLTVRVHGNESITINGLTVGETYTVTEITDWSWRYTLTGWAFGGTISVNDDNSVNITLNAKAEDNVLTCTNDRNVDQWLDGDAYYQNHFKN